MGLIATIAALVLSLLIASAHSAYDTQESEVRQLAVHVVLLDRMLARYGPEAAAHVPYCGDRRADVRASGLRGRRDGKDASGHAQHGARTCSA